MKKLKPESVGFSSERLNRISAWMETYVEEGKLSGVVASVSRFGQTVYKHKTGWADCESRIPMESDSIFRIMSMTKPVIAAAIMILYEEGCFNLNTPISDFIPSFKDVKVLTGSSDGKSDVEDLIRPISFRHLFTHTAGFILDGPVYESISRARNAWRKGDMFDERRGTLKDLVEMILQVPLAYQPGTRFCYSIATDVLGYLIEVISGKPLDQFLKERLFDPLEMDDTDFFVSSDKAHRLTSLYGQDDNPGRIKLLEKSAESSFLKKPLLLSGGGGLVSTLKDYSHFLQMFINGGEFKGNRILSPTTVDLFSINQAPSEALPFNIAGNEDLFHRGYGFSLATRVLMNVGQSGQAGSVGEFGWDGMYCTHCWVDRSLGIYGIFMTQFDSFNHYPLADTFKQLTYQALVNL